MLVMVEQVNLNFFIIKVANAPTLKETVCLISSEPQSKAGNARFTAVSLKL